MLINGIQLSALGATLHNRVFSTNNVETSEDWNEGSLQPTFIRQQDTFKDIELQFLITEENEEDAFITMSNLTMLLRKATLIFDDLPHLQFDVIMQGQGKQERLKNGNFLFTVSLKSDYAKGASEVHTTNTAATDSFKLSIVYYKDSTTLIATESVTINASSFVGVDNITLEDLGISINKYQEAHYNNGVVTNFSGLTISYENLYSLGTMIINYSPITYSKLVGYYLNNGEGAYKLVEEVYTRFTYFNYEKMTSIGQLVNLNRNRPTGYKAKVTPPELPTFDELMALQGSINIYFDIAEDDRTKEITVNYYQENENSNDLISSQTILVRESDIVEGTVISNILNLNGNKPNEYYDDGYCVEVDDNVLLTFDDLLDSYTIQYNRTETTIYVEYYLGSYPNWNRKATDTCKIKYDSSYDSAENIFEALNINLNKYKTDYYENGLVFNSEVFTDFQAVASIGVIQIYYVPKEYTITVKYVQDADDGTEVTELGTKDYKITDLMFVTTPKLSELININEFRPEGYSYSEDDSYKGEMSIPALTQASPITITYKPIAVVNTKSIVIKYKKQLASTYSTINTSVITIEEAAVGGGIRLKDLFEIDKYKPDYYNTGIVDGYSIDSVVLFEEIQGTYDVYYFATSYSTQVRYYTDEVATENWIGSDRINYTVLDFEADTTAVSLGVDINAYKPSYCGDGEIQYYGATTFENLRNLASINIVYMSETEPGDDDIDYPHRILFLQHNDMGSYDTSFPTWTLNHAYINTGVTCLDMSKLTVAMSTVRVFEDQPLYNVNVGDRYLFGASSPNGDFYIKYQNNTTYTSNPTGHNYFIAAAGKETPLLQIEETSDNGFSRNTGIYASEREGYSYATLTYSNLIQTNNAQMLIPLYLFACNRNGNYVGGIAGVGITACKIYYDGVLLRDFVPVQYYDLIGTKVAPSNCLYDKVTQTFFEDARGLNSFNIMDDDMYEDTNPDHNIGKCYCNYSKGGNFFQSRVIYFRESDFINGNVWDPMIKLGVDDYQPEFFGEGSITNLDKLGGVTFNNVKDFVFEVNYPETGYYIDINYFKDTEASGNLLGTEKVYLKEKDFYSVPTFGMLVDLLKYKPDGYGLYQEDIPYKDTKVTLKRLLKNAPYTVVYKSWIQPETRTVTAKYYKHRNWIEPKNPINQYTFLGEQEITIDATQVIDGVYPEQFINFNLYKPADEPDYWYPGAPFEWYTKDENLLSLTDLRDEYIITYEPRTQYIDINYYTDEVDEANLIANSTWGIKINDWDFGYEFQVTDELPNSYFNKYKPANCDAGILQDSDAYYTFDSLVKKGHLDIVYMTMVEPHDPEDDSFPNKVLWYYPDKGTRTIGNGIVENGETGRKSKDWTQHNGGCFAKPGYGPYIPYLDLGYTPKEIQRLRMQTKFYSLGGSMHTGGSDFAPETMEGMNIVGYSGPMSRDKLYHYIGRDDAVDLIYGSGVGQDYDLYSKNSPESSGYFFIRGHCPLGYFGGSSRRSSHNFWGGVLGVDNNNGMKWSNTLQTQVTDGEIYHSCYKGVTAGFRFGNYVGYDEDLEVYKENDDHIYKVENGDHKGHKAKSFSNGLAEIWSSDRKCVFEYPDDMDSVEFDNSGDWREFIPNHGDENTLWTEDWQEMNPSTFFHPYTVTLDAYNGFCEIYDMSNSEDPYHWDIDTSNDLNLFTDRCKPKGPITLFVSTNPDTGQVNIIPSFFEIMPRMTNYNDKIEGYSDSRPGQTSEGEGSGGQSAPGTSTGANTGGSTGGGSGSDSQIEIYGGLLNMEYNPYTTVMNCPWGNGRSDAFPVPMRTAVWGLKIWDRDRLVRNLIPVAKGDKVYDYVMPENGMFDLVTEIFFGNVNKGGNYGYVYNGIFGGEKLINIKPDEVFTLRVNDDPTTYGKIVANYYDYDNQFIGNQWVEIPCDYFHENISFKDILKYNDMKPSLYYHDGMIDTDVDIEDDVPNRNKLKSIYDQGAINIYYKQKQYTKTVVYYRGNTRVASKDFFFSQNEIEAAESLADLGVDPNLYQTEDFKPGVIMSDETIIASDDVAAFINAPSPVVVYEKWSKEERPDLFYYEYYRGGAYEEEGQETITVNSENKNYLDCDLTAIVLNPNGLIKYVDHYHDALYEDEKQSYFISYQVDINVNYCEVHKGPARAYKLLAEITDRGRYTIVEENRGWGRLKEYPKGWILLKYTNPIIGPGQNPDYDNSDVARVTIPFATRLSITKMTIDRLWAYTPEYGSWIKTEEISFDQSGRLYNALGMGVLHLDDVDWTQVSSLSDLGINPEAYRLRFHDACGYTYSGEYTEAAFSDLHSVDFVYPETIYPYVIKYYKDTLDNSNIVGTGAFSCSLSDWNPDWDTFISTSWKTGYPATVTIRDTFHRTVGLTKDYNTVAVRDKMYVISTIPVSVDNKNCYQCIWKGYIGYYPISALSVDTSLVETISPTLYRSGEPIYLTWDFYGLDANLYKPGPEYNDGMFLWNPRTYDNNDVKFSFEEIITTGKQTILYSPIMDIGYKAKFTNGWMKLPMDITDFYYVPTASEPGIWDIEIKYQPSYESSVDDSTSDHYSNILETRQTIIPGDTIKYGNYNVGNRPTYTGIQTGRRTYSVGDTPGRDIDIIHTGTNHSSQSGDYIDTTTYYDSSYIDGSVVGNYYNIINFSNKRSYDKAICQITGNDLTNWENKTPVFKERRNVRYANNDDYTYDDTSFSISNLNIGNGCYYKYNNSGNSLDFFENKAVGNNIVYYIKVWKNYYLEHYYVPVPKGYWLPNNTQVTYNTFYDLVTQTICTKSTLQYNYTYSNGSITLPNNYPDIYKLHQPAIGSGLDIFEDWNYTIVDTDRIIITTSRISAYKHPDILSGVLATIDKGTVIPIKKMVLDSAEEHVQGLWYYTGEYWIKANSTEITTLDTPVTEIQKTLALKGDESNTAATYYGFRRPSDAIPDYFDISYVKGYTNNSISSFDTGINYKLIGKMELDFDYIDNPYTSSKDSDGYYLNSYVFGAGAYSPVLAIDSVESKFSIDGSHTINYTATKGSHYNVVIELSGNDDSWTYTYYINGSLVGTEQGHGGRGNYDAHMLVAGDAVVNYGISNDRRGLKINFHYCKIWNTSNVLTREYRPRVKIENDSQVAYIYETTNGYQSLPQYWSFDNVDFIAPQSNYSTFTTEQLEKFYFSSNDFYWNGKMWIPASYTEDYVIELAEPKTLIVATTTLYTYSRPLEQVAYKVSNLLNGDRITAIGTLGKDSKWYKLNDNTWVYDNNTLNELEV